MDASHVAEEIVDYLPRLSKGQQAEVLRFVKALAEDLPEPQVKLSEDYAKVVERRFQEHESGIDPGVPWEEVRLKGRALFAKR